MIVYYHRISFDSACIIINTPRAVRTMINALFDLACRSRKDVK